MSDCYTTSRINTSHLICTHVQQEEERQLQLEHLAYQEQEASKQRERQKQITASTEVAKREVNKALRKRRYALKKKEVTMIAA